MPTRRKRRGVDTVPIYSHVIPEARDTIERIAEATGAHKNVVIEQVLQHVETDECGVPLWWDLDISPTGQQELPLTG